MPEFGSQGSSSVFSKAATLWRPEYPNVPRYLDGWYRLNPKCPRDPVLPFYDVSLRGFLPIHAHHCTTHTKPRILFHKYDKSQIVWTTWIPLLIQHTFTNHTWTQLTMFCPEHVIKHVSPLLRMWYAIAHAVTWRKNIRIFSWSKVIFAESCSKDSSLFVANISPARTLDYIHILHHTSTDHILLLGKSS